MARADELATTPAERACLAALRSAAGESEGAMERHCVRVFRIAERIGEDAGVEVDRELLLCAALIHDAGLFPGVASDDVYLRDGRRLAEDTLEPFGWPPERLQRCLDAIERHHVPRSQWELGTEVELLRRADLVDVSGGVIAFGVDRWWLRVLGREVPRAGFYALLAKEGWRMARERPRTYMQILNPERGS